VYLINEKLRGLQIVFNWQSSLYFLIIHPTGRGGKKMSKIKIINCVNCGTKVVTTTRATNILRCKKCRKARRAAQQILARAIGRTQARAGSPKKGKTKLVGMNFCSCCQQRRVFIGLRYLCYDCWENWGDNVVNARDDKEIYRHLKKLTRIEANLRHGLSSKATILTTSPETLLRYPNAIMVNQRYAKHYVGNKTVNFFPGLGG
jgi:hypothetical protein